MVRHICMFDFLEEAGGRSREENIAITKAMLEALPETIDCIRKTTVAVNAPMAASESNWDLVLITDFDSFEDLERYRVHPDHVAVGVFMRPVRCANACVDIEI